MLHSLLELEYLASVDDLRPNLIALKGLGTCLVAASVQPTLAGVVVQRER